MTRIKTLFICLLACGLNYPMVLSALAQEETIVLDPIVVSGGKQKVASDTPQSVSVVNQDELDRKQPTTVGDALTDLPGVKSSGSDRVLGEFFNIRGFGQDNSGGEGRLILQVDGTNKYYQQYRMGSLFTDPELYKRVEVLRGPASSTLYGSGALAGVITLETKDASDFLEDDDHFALRQKLEMTNNGYGGLSSTILASRPSENLEFLGAFIYRNNDDITDGNGAWISGSAFDAPSVLVKSRYQFGNDNTQAVELSYQHWLTQEDQADYEQTGSNAEFGFVDREVTDKTVVLAYDNRPLNSDLINFKARLSYSDTRVVQKNANNSLPPRFATSVLFDNSEYAYENYQLSAENTSIFGPDTGLQTFLTYGAQASWQTRTGKADRGFIAFQPGGTDSKLAAFAQAEMVFSKRLTLIPGLRVERAELDPDALNTAFTQTVANTAISPKLAAFFEINPNWSLFGSAASTQRLPVLDEIFDGRSGNLDLVPETAITYEGGASYTTNDVFFGGDALVAKATVFRSDTENLIKRASTSDPFVNVAEARIDGLELEAAYDSSRFFGNLAFTVTRGEGREDSGGPTEPLDTIPADELALTLGVRFPARNLELGLRSVLAASQDDVPKDDPTVRTPTPGYGIHDVFATWRPDEGLVSGMELRLGIENLFDRQYREHLSNDPGRGRTLRLSASQTF